MIGTKHKQAIYTQVIIDTSAANVRLRPVCLEMTYLDISSISTD